jgi:hypothetical protein
MQTHSERSPLLRRALVALAALGALFGCTPGYLKDYLEDAPLPRNEQTVPRLCQKMCDREVACGAATGAVAQCLATCAQDHGQDARYGGRRRPYWRADYVEGVLGCIDAASCDLVADETRFLVQCFQDTSPAPTQLSKEVCSLERENALRCGGSLVPETCAGAMAVFSDDVLRRAAASLAADGCNWGVRRWNEWMEAIR